MKKYVYTTLFLLLLGIKSYSQCDGVKTINRPDNSIIKYFNPQSIIDTPDYEVGTSIYYNQTSNSYLVSISVAFKKGYQMDINGNLSIQLNGSNEAISLGIVVSERAQMNGIDVSYAMYEIDNKSLYLLRKYSIRHLFFNMGNKAYGSTIDKNHSIYIEQLKCL